MYKAKLKRKHSHIQKRIVFILILVLCMIMMGGVFAKYIYNNGGINLFSAKEFYFTSNLLTEDTGKYVLNSTTSEISFTLGNNADKLRVSQDSIAYTLSVECKEGLETGDPLPNLSEIAGELTGNTVSTTTITLSNLVRGKTYIVTATGTAGYKQTLKAEFYVSDNDENVYKHLDTSNSAYVLLTVWTENVAGTLEVEFNNNGLIPDNTDDVLREIYNYDNNTDVYGKISFKDEENFTNTYSSYTYRFFRDSAADINVDQFGVNVVKNDSTYMAIKADTLK